MAAALVGGVAAVWAIVEGAKVFINGAGEVIETYNERTSRQTGRFSLTVGVPQPGDVLLYREKIRPAPVVLGYQKHEYKYTCKRNEVITYVEARDNWDDGTGGSPKITSGGPGQNHVIVTVTSQFSRGFDFTVSVHGKKG